MQLALQREELYYNSTLYLTLDRVQLNGDISYECMARDKERSARMD